MQKFSSVREFVSERLEQLQMFDEHEKQYVRFTISLDVLNNRRIEYLAKALQMSKSAFCADVICAAAADLEDELGMDLSDQHSDYFKHVFGRPLKEDNHE